MKKIILLLLIIPTMLLVSCGYNTQKFVQQNISDIRHNIFDGQSDNFYSTIVSGYRELPYAPDGISNRLVSFAIVEVVPFEQTQIENANYCVVINNHTYSGLLEKNPITNSLMVDLGIIVDDNDKIELSVELESKETIQLENQSKNWDYNYKAALEKSINHYKKAIEEYDKKDVDVEFHLKILAKMEGETKNFFWHFTIFCAKERHNIVFDVFSGEILAEN